ncbi:hypothetical protein, partial [Sphingobacterium daejeonense]|uniref:hypothetical protein n=1 Tax=Sphingobacterium daejeonense TaxID=371142 RepID=UPI003D322308
VGGDTYQGIYTVAGVLTCHTPPWLVSPPATNHHLAFAEVSPPWLASSPATNYYLAFTEGSSPWLVSPPATNHH